MDLAITNKTNMNTMILLSKFDLNLILVITFVIVEKTTPKHSLWKEIVEQKNLALAVVAGCFMLAIAIIIASAIH
jgi:putative membrane protein